MRVYDNGAFYTVAVYAAEVQAFNRSWPCSSLPARSISFQFDKSSGDLVDIMPYDIADQVDGPEAVALGEDAMRYGAERLRLESVLQLRAKQ